MDLPFIRPTPAKLSQLSAELQEIESSGTYTNFGPVNTRFEASATAQLFGGEGSCLTVCNATIGLMLAIQAAIEPQVERGRRFALMPSFTFAATAHAAIWCGLEPLFCDIDPATWLPDAESERALLKTYGSEIAILVPYATFGNNLDLVRYESLSAEFGVPVVVDAAASLGSCIGTSRGFGQGSVIPSVFSMHVTKTFATAEAGLIYSADSDLIHRLRVKSNFGFGQPRSATMLGLNAKLPEVTALLAEIKLRDFQDIVVYRESLFKRYTEKLPFLSPQRHVGTRIAHQFMPLLLPSDSAGRRDELIAKLAECGIGAGKYFAPHLAAQPFFRARSPLSALPITEDISARTISLPIHDEMTVDDVDRISAALCLLLDAKP